MKIACSYLLDRWYTGWVHKIETRVNLTDFTKYFICHVIDSYDFSDEEVPEQQVRVFSSLKVANLFSQTGNKEIERADKL